MLSIKQQFSLLKAILANPQIIRAKFSINLFLLQYLRKFKVKTVNSQLVIHSHLPSINSKAYSRFINEHLLSGTVRPSHAQIGLTNACPQNCAYCYNKNHTGKIMDKETIIQTIRDLKKLGVFWLGFTGGEPLLNKDILEITESVGDDCVIKLFTTGCNLTPSLAAGLKKAGLFYVSVSLDHWNEPEHDRIRGYQGAFQVALKAIEIFKNEGFHVSVSTVLTKDSFREEAIEHFLEFLTGLGVHEAWLSEAKPAIADLWNPQFVISEMERKKLSALQDRYNKKGKLTVNYLGHFEGKEHFGCTAGHKMVYIDAFGEVSPCVFIPMSFGNVRHQPLPDIFRKMQQHFPLEGECFINKNYRLLQKYYQGQLIDQEDSLRIIREVKFEPPGKFFQKLYHEVRK
jgi:MoaA/NifB/PqqE/SkfB family radical SAM enzyme